jgi:hypothetical protein
MLLTLFDVISFGLELHQRPPPCRKVKVRLPGSS